jgi:hypothetical protein
MIAHTHGPSISPEMIGRQVMGPREAPYSMTVSGSQPLIGPQICICNVGKHLHG